MVENHSEPPLAARAGRPTSNRAVGRLARTPGGTPRTATFHVRQESGRSERGKLPGIGLTRALARSTFVRWPTSGGVILPGVGPGTTPTVHLGWDAEGAGGVSRPKWMDGPCLKG